MTVTRKIERIWCNICQDHRISAGAFRAWHCLFWYANPDTSESSPGIRTMARATGSDKESLTRWLKQLEVTGWIERISDGARGFRSVYRIMDGCGNSVFDNETQSAGQMLRISLSEDAMTHIKTRN